MENEKREESESPCDSSSDFWESESEAEDCSRYDLFAKEIITECELKPTETDNKTLNWLHARNNKYKYLDIDPDLAGKWKLFVASSEINDLWIRINEAVKDGHLWQCKVSTKENLHHNYAVMIYTKDYTDIEDVIDVLNYLEKSGIKLQEDVIYYEPENQILSWRKNSHPWIYASNTIRETKKPYSAVTNTVGTDRGKKGQARKEKEELNIDDRYCALYDFTTKKVIKECELKPTDICTKLSLWLSAENNRYTDNDPNLRGKWIVIVPSTKVNDVWIQIKEAIKEGHLWNSKVSTANPEKDTHVIMIYTKDYTDIRNVIEVLDYLEKSGIKPQEKVICYKTDSQSRAGIYAGGKRMYASNTIRNSWGAPKGHKMNRSNETNEYLSWRKRP